MLADDVTVFDVRKFKLLMAKHLPSQKKLIWNSVLFTLKLNTIFRSELQTRYITFHSKWYFLNCSQKDVEFSRRNFRLDPNSQLHHFKDLRFSRYSRLSTAISTSPTRKWIRMNLHSSILSVEIFTLFLMVLMQTLWWTRGERIIRYSNIIRIVEAEY